MVRKLSIGLLDKRGMQNSVRHMVAAQRKLRAPSPQDRAKVYERNWNAQSEILGSSGTA
jgi:hypothetical protein